MGAILGLLTGCNVKFTALNFSFVLNLGLNLVRHFLENFFVKIFFIAIVNITEDEVFSKESLCPLCGTSLGVRFSASSFLEVDILPGSVYDLPSAVAFCAASFQYSRH